MVGLRPSQIGPSFTLVKRVREHRWAYADDGILGCGTWIVTLVVGGSNGETE